MVNKKSWEEFKESGLLWMINQTLHLFGWAIVLYIEDGKVIGAYPARIKFRGFDEKANTKGYKKCTKYLKENIDELLEEVNE